jgi:hypothetical protein
MKLKGIVSRRQAGDCEQEWEYEALDHSDSVLFGAGESGCGARLKGTAQAHGATFLASTGADASATSSRTLTSSA